MTTHAVKPVLEENFPNFPKIWKCPETGLRVPKEPDKNLAWRIELLAKADRDEGLQRDLLAACKASILFHMNAFCFTYRQKQYGADGRERPSQISHVPFVTWPVQDEAILSIKEGVEMGEDRAIDKSRDMGATWICIAVLDHLWLYEPDSQILALSRTEDYVDKPGNHKALFWKLDYLHEWYPDWMRPPACLPGQKFRTRMHMKNELNGSVIDGESTTENAARGDRRKVIFMDEFAAVQNGQAMRSATADVAPCRIINSTPSAGSEYSKWVTSGQIKTVRLMWWEHPEKGLGRYVVQDEVTKKWKIRSPYYDFEESRRSPQEVAENLDASHFGAGQLFFEPEVLEQHKALFARKSIKKLLIDFKDDVPYDSIKRIIRGRVIDKLKVAPSTGKRGLKIWANLIDGRLDQTKNYVMGIDVSRGQGASNSVISIRCKETKEKVAEFADANTPPYEFALVAVAIAIWVGGSNPRRLPYMVWEANGPGWDFGRIVVLDLGYPYYYLDEPAGKISVSKSKKYGWSSSRQKKHELLSVYRRMLAQGLFFNPCEDAITEAGTYIHYDDGYVGPAFLVEESENARGLHGDRVIADALSTLMDKEIRPNEHEAVRPPKGSAGYRKQQLIAKRKRLAKSKHSWRQPFDFRDKKELKHA